MSKYTMTRGMAKKDAVFLVLEPTRPNLQQDWHLAFSFEQYSLQYVTD